MVADALEHVYDLDELTLYQYINEDGTDVGQNGTPLPPPPLGPRWWPLGGLTPRPSLSSARGPCPVRKKAQEVAFLLRNKEVLWKARDQFRRTVPPPTMRDALPELPPKGRSRSNSIESSTASSSWNHRTTNTNDGTEPDWDDDVTTGSARADSRPLPPLPPGTNGASSSSAASAGRAPLARPPSASSDGRAGSSGPGAGAGPGASSGSAGARLPPHTEDIEQWLAKTLDKPQSPVVTRTRRVRKTSQTSASAALPANYGHPGHPGHLGHHASASVGAVTEMPLAAADGGTAGAYGKARSEHSGSHPPSPLLGSLAVPPAAPAAKAASAGATPMTAALADGVLVSVGPDAGARASPPRAGPGHRRERSLDTATHRLATQQHRPSSLYQRELALMSTLTEDDIMAAVTADMQRTELNEVFEREQRQQRFRQYGWKGTRRPGGR